MKRKRVNRRTFIFSIVLWDETGNILLESHTMKVRRVNQWSAKGMVIQKYPRPYFCELDSIIN